MSQLFDIVFTLVILSMLATNNAHAYIDPGSGSYMLQIIAAGVLSGIFIMKKFWRNISKFISSFLKKNSGDKD